MRNSDLISFTLLNTYRQLSVYIIIYRMRISVFPIVYVLGLYKYD